MSVYGGDSWGREAENRKRRVDELILEGVERGDSYKKLSSGKYLCLICPHSPVLDAPLMLSMHCKGSRHRAAEAKLKERELMRKDEISKRLALSSSSDGFEVSGSTSNKKARLGSKPLVEETRRVASEILCNKTSRTNYINNQKLDAVASGSLAELGEDSSCVAIQTPRVSVGQQQWDYRERRERELKFTQAGWKRDGYGKWYKDENVEFDSDEEDPNVCLG